MHVSAVSGVLVAIFLFAQAVYWIDLSIDRNPVEAVEWLTLAIFGLAFPALVAYIAI